MNAVTTRPARVVIEMHTWKGEVAGYEVRNADAPRDTTADVLATFGPTAKAEAGYFADTGFRSGAIGADARFAAVAAHAILSKAAPTEADLALVEAVEKAESGLVALKNAYRKAADEGRPEDVLNMGRDLITSASTALDTTERVALGVMLKVRDLDIAAIAPKDFRRLIEAIAD